MVSVRYRPELPISRTFDDHLRTRGSALTIVLALTRRTGHYALVAEASIRDSSPRFDCFEASATLDSP